MLTIQITTTGQPIVTAPASITVTVQTRDPVRYWTVAIPSQNWPGTDDVPAHYRALVDAMLLNNAEAILSKYVKDATKSKQAIPLVMFSLEALTSVTTSGRMTGADLVNLWKQTHKYIYHVAVQLTSKQGSDLLKYKANIEKHEKRIIALASKEPESKLTPKDVKMLLDTMSPEDQDGTYAQIVIARCEAVLEKQAVQDDAI